MSPIRIEKARERRAFGCKFSSREAQFRIDYDTGLYHEDTASALL